MSGFEGFLVDDPSGKVPLDLLIQQARAAYTLRTGLAPVVCLLGFGFSDSLETSGLQVVRSVRWLARKAVFVGRSVPGMEDLAVKIKT